MDECAFTAIRKNLALRPHASFWKGSGGWSEGPGPKWDFVTFLALPIS